MRPGGGPTTVNMTSPITINGVTTGQAEAVGRAVARALRDPDRQLITQLKLARDYELRLGYV
jgi:ribosomal protein S9